MIKAPGSLQELRRRIYRKAKSEPQHRFWGIFVHVAKIETLGEAYRLARLNGGAPGTDGQTFAAIDAVGVDAFLQAIREVGKNSTRVRKSPGRIVRSKSRRATARSECSRSRAFATAWCREP